MPQPVVGVLYYYGFNLKSNIDRDDKGQIGFSVNKRVVEKIVKSFYRICNV